MRMLSKPSSTRSANRQTKNPRISSIPLHEGTGKERYIAPQIPYSDSLLQFGVPITRNSVLRARSTLHVLGWHSTSDPPSSSYTAFERYILSRRQKGFANQKDPDVLLEDRKGNEDFAQKIHLRRVIITLALDFSKFQLTCNLKHGSVCKAALPTREAKTND